jgi:hypothetical protein
MYFIMDLAKWSCDIKTNSTIFLVGCLWVMNLIYRGRMINMFKWLQKFIAIKIKKTWIAYSVNWIDKIRPRSNERDFEPLEDANQRNMVKFQIRKIGLVIGHMFNYLQLGAKEHLTFKGVQMTTLDFFPIYIIIIVVDCLCQ